MRRRREGRKVLSCRSGAKVFSALGVWEPSGITGKDCPPWEARNFRRKSKPLLDTIFAGQDIAQGKESEVKFMNTTGRIWLSRNPPDINVGMVGIRGRMAGPKQKLSAEKR